MTGCFITVLVLAAVTTVIATTKSAMQEELKAHQRMEVARILAILEAYRAEHGFDIVYDSNGKAQVGLSLLPSGLHATDRTAAVLLLVNL